ncbi:MAG: TlpA family protein disulfide reductase [Chlorobi bacterium]|nr:TlpA family protein disulfide reductase [Chlorobiota bacterium]
MTRMSAGRVLTALAMFAILSVSALADAAPSPAPKAPVFSAAGVDGKAVSSRQLAGKAYIVNFFASWCPPCRQEIPDMVALQKTYRAKGFTFVGVAVAPGQNENSVKSFMKSSGINYPVIYDGNNQLVDLFRQYDTERNLKAIPTSFVVDRSGRIILVISGARSKADFEKMIVDALKPVKAVK